MGASAADGKEFRCVRLTGDMGTIGSGGRGVMTGGRSAGVGKVQTNESDSVGVVGRDVGFTVAEGEGFSFGLGINSGPFVLKSRLVRMVICMSLVVCRIIYDIPTMYNHDL